MKPRALRVLPTPRAHAKMPASVGRSCPLCQEEVRGTRSALLQHLVVHTGEAPYGCPVVGCDKTFTQSASGHRHVRQQHGPDRATRPVTLYRDHGAPRANADMPAQGSSCPHCAYVAPKRSVLCKHIARHTAERRYECLMCAKRFTDTSTFYRHAQKVHPAAV